MALIRIEYIISVRGRKKSIAYIPHQNIVDIFQLRNGQTKIMYRNYDSTAFKVISYRTRETPDSIAKRIREEVRNETEYVAFKDPSL